MSQKKQSRTSAKVILLMPHSVHRELKHLAAEEGCSMSWIVTELVMDRVGMTPGELEKFAGPRPPKRFRDRVGNWTPAKNKSREKSAGKDYSHLDKVSPVISTGRRVVRCTGCDLTGTVTEKYWHLINDSGQIEYCSDCKPEEFK